MLYDVGQGGNEIFTRVLVRPAAASALLQPCRQLH
jgi:hypothetical protein